MDRRRRLRRLFASGGGFLLALSASAIVNAATELLDVSSMPPVLAAVLYPVLALLVLATVGIEIWSRRGRGRERSGVSDPRLRRLLRELEIEQAKFDRAMPGKSS